MADQVTNYQCPACTGPLHFVGESGKLECDYCGSAYEVSEIEALYQQKEEQARQRKRENELKKVEARIEELETRDKEIDETMILPDICTNVAECAKLSKEKAAITEELEGLYEKWEELA